MFIFVFGIARIAAMKNLPVLGDSLTENAMTDTRTAPYAALLLLSLIHILQDDWIKALVDTAASISEALGYEPSVSSGFNGLGMAAEAMRT